MAYIGLAKPTIATLKETNGSESYTGAFECGKAIQIDVSPQYAEGSLFADNVKAEYDKEFKYADVTLGTSTLPLTAHSIMFGHTVSEDTKGVTYKAQDEPKYVGFGFYVTEKVDGVRKYTAAWLYKVKFSEGTESYKTKGDTIEYQTPSITGQAIALEDGRWKDVQQFDTEKAAADWVKEKASQAAA